jgi:hypothetical protein
MFYAEAKAVDIRFVFNFNIDQFDALGEVRASSIGRVTHQSSLGHCLSG